MDAQPSSSSFYVHSTVHCAPSGDFGTVRRDVLGWSSGYASIVVVCDLDTGRMGRDSNR